MLGLSPVDIGYGVEDVGPQAQQHLAFHGLCESGISGVDNLLNHC